MTRTYGSRIVSCVLAAMLLALAGCRGTTVISGGEEKPPTYFQKRGRDALDIFRLQIGGGVTAHVDVQLGQLAHFGVGGNTADYVVLCGLTRGAWRVTEERYKCFPFSNIAAAADAGPKGLLVMHARHEYIRMSREPDYSDACAGLLPLFFNYNVKTKNFEMTREPPTRWLDLEVGASFVFMVRVGFSPGEMVDFLLGWFGIDLAGDDAKPRELPLVLPGENGAEAGPTGATEAARKGVSR